MDHALTPFPYQQQGVERLLEILRSSSARAALMADPPGAGKSPMTIMTFQALDARRVLIVCPKSLKLNWAREVERWTDGRYRTVVLKTSKDELPDVEDGKGSIAVVVSYGLTCREPLKDRLLAVKWDFLAMDESHTAMRTPTAAISKVCGIVLWKAARYRLPITGTPIPNGRAAEAYILFSRLAPDLFGKWEAYRDRYCVKEETPWGVKYPRSRNLEELGRLAKERFMVRRPKEEVLAQLPGLVRQTVPLEVPRLLVEEAQCFGDDGGDQFRDATKMVADHFVDVNKMVAEVERAIESGIPLTSDPISTARRKLGILKVGPALEFIQELLEEVESVVVFCHHREVFQSLLEGLRDVGVVSISGGTSSRERQAAVDAFQKPGGPRVFLASITAAGVGITLTRSHTAVFVEASWVPSDLEQAEARILRVSQTEICRAIYLVVPDSLDEKVLAAVQRKRRNIEKVMAS